MSGEAFIETTLPTPASTGSVPLAMVSVSKRYGQRTALSGLTLSVERGEIVALLGPNGAGKSTTLALSLGFIQADSGTVRVGDIDIAQSPEEARRRVGYIPENVQLYPTLSGLENLQYFSALSGIDLPDGELRAALLRSGLPANAHEQRLSGYSKGMRQKTGIAIALARRCELLLLDEPTSGLDPVAADDFNDLLQQASADGAGTLMATHDLSRVLKIAHRVIILREGTVVASFDRPQFAGVDLQATYMDAMRGTVHA